MYEAGRRYVEGTRVAYVMFHTGGLLGGLVGNVQQRETFFRTKPNVISRHDDIIPLN